MTSEIKLASNRTNAKKNTGPKTARGKSRASRNAWRHGWAVAKRDDSAVSADVKRMATAICGGSATTALYQHAVIIAECETLLLKLRAARVAAIQRNRIIEPMTEPTNQLSGVPTIKEFGAALEALGEPSAAMRSLTRDLCEVFAAAAKSIDANIGPKKSHQRGGEQLSALLVNSADAAAQRLNEDERASPSQDEVGAFRRALPELVSFDRYERRAMSRRRRAIRMFDAISVAAPFLDRKAKDV
jgi:hypothetical protein